MCTNKVLLSLADKQLIQQKFSTLQQIYYIAIIWRSQIHSSDMATRYELEASYSASFARHLLTYLLTITMNIYINSCGSNTRRLARI